MKILDLIMQLHTVYFHHGNLPVTVEVKTSIQEAHGTPGEWRDPVRIFVDQDGRDEPEYAVILAAPSAVDQLTAESQKNGEYPWTLSRFRLE